MYDSDEMSIDMKIAIKKPYVPKALRICGYIQDTCVNLKAFISALDIPEREMHIEAFREVHRKLNLTLTHCEELEKEIRSELNKRNQTY